MSTHASFERHKKEASKHESNVFYLLNKEDQQRTATLQSLPGDEKLRCTSASKIRSAVAQQRLALREYKEAARLRPRDVETKEQLQSARLVLRKLQALVDGPKQIPMRRFLAHYNLSIRYWDKGEARQAIDEARESCKELAKHGLPRGCAEHNLLLMMQVFSEFKGEQKKLEDAVQRSPEAIGSNYDLGIHFFDKRMMHKAEAQLRLTRDRAKASTALQLVEQDMLSLQGEDAPTLDGKRRCGWREFSRTSRMISDSSHASKNFGASRRSPGRRVNSRRRAFETDPFHSCFPVCIAATLRTVPAAMPGYGT